MINKASKIYVAGHAGLVGTALVSKLKTEGYTNLLLRTRDELDLLNEAAVSNFLSVERPELVIDCAAKVGGVKDKLDHPAEFLVENLNMQNNLIWGSYNAGVKQLIFIGSAVIYPVDCPQPIKEEFAMSGSLDSTNEPYALAKMSGMKLCEYINQAHGLAYASCAPNNLYGPNDNFNHERAHVLPALMMRIHDAKINNHPEVVVWGTGKVRREFLHVEDLVSALVWMAENYTQSQFLNIGSGEDVSIKELAEIMKVVIGYEGKLTYDASKPEGVPRRLLDSSRLHDLGWKPTISLEAGIRQTYEWYLNNVA